jgi:glucan 1,3-beta-glucosidase
MKWFLPNIFRRTPSPITHPPLRGVNLGGWLVLERWITPSLFGDLLATDEYTLCRMGGAAIAGRIRVHRDTFITKADFIWLKSQGIGAVRLPVGYWVFGDESPYASTIEYVDKVFAWAAETGLVVLLDMHAAPGSQNGWDHSGRAGKCTWHTDEQNIIKTLEVVGRLAKRYARHPQLLGIELLNEPKWTVPRAPLLHYYTAAYKLIRKECGTNVWVVFSDNFRPRRWKRKLRGDQYTNVLMDTHQYQVFAAKDKRLDVVGHLHKTIDSVPRALARMRRYHPIIIGEWSLALDAQSLRGLDEQQIDSARRAYSAAQLLVYSQSSAWFYWTYRTEKSDDIWSFRNCIRRGWL